jgi:hypothetical protein
VVPPLARDDQDTVARRVGSAGPKAQEKDIEQRVADADDGDTTTIVETTIAAAEQVEHAQADVKEPQPLEEIIADKGYHSNQTIVDLDAVGIRSYVSEPDRGRRDWSEEPEAQALVYGNRRRIRGRRGRRLMRQSGGFNLGLLIRARLGVGTPRGLQGAAARVSWALFRALLARLDRITVLVTHEWSIPGSRESNRVSSLSLLMATRRVGFTTGC